MTLKGQLQASGWLETSVSLCGVLLVSGWDGKRSKGLGCSYTCLDRTGECNSHYTKIAGTNISLQTPLLIKPVLSDKSQSLLHNTPSSRTKWEWCSSQLKRLLANIKWENACEIKKHKYHNALRRVSEIVALKRINCQTAEKTDCNLPDPFHYRDFW